MFLCVSVQSDRQSTHLEQQSDHACWKFCKSTHTIPTRFDHFLGRPCTLKLLWHFSCLFRSAVCKHTFWLDFKASASGAVDAQVIKVLLPRFQVECIGSCGRTGDQSKTGRVCMCLRVVYLEYILVVSTTCMSIHRFFCLFRPAGCECTQDELLRMSIHSFCCLFWPAGCEHTVDQRQPGGGTCMTIIAHGRSSA